jgi:signal transduction histidine kinase
VIGFVEITRDDNPNILDTTNRQDFLSTPEYRDLKNFIYEQLDIFMELYKIERTIKKEERLNVFQDSKTALMSIQKEIIKLQKTKDTKTQTASVSKIMEEVAKLQTGFDGISTEYTAVEKEKGWVEQEKIRREKIFFSLLSQSTFAINMGHTLRDNIKNIKDRAYYISEEPLNNESAEIFKRYAANIFTEITDLLPVIDFMLSAAKTNLPAEKFDLKKAIASVFEAHQLFFEEKRVDISLDLMSNISVLANEFLFKDIITCLISNAVKAMQAIRERKIYCSLRIDGNSIVILFSDNGSGIPKDKWDWVFGLYNTTTEAQGGVGIGLHIVKKNIEELNGTVCIIDNNHFENGTTVCITIPQLNP